MIYEFFSIENIHPGGGSMIDSIIGFRAADQIAGFSCKVNYSIYDTHAGQAMCSPPGLNKWTATFSADVEQRSLQHFCGARGLAICATQLSI